MRTRLVKIAGRCVAGLVVGLVLAAAMVLVVLPKAVHGVALTVLTGSMTPTIPVGSVVVERPVDPRTLHIGDVATYQAVPGKAVYITHRIVKIETRSGQTLFTFKGDANRGPDMTPIPSGAIRGKVWFHVPYLGSVRDAISTRGGVTGIAMVLLAGYALWQVGATVSRRGRTRSVNAPAAAIATYDPEAHLILATFPLTSFDGLPADVAAHLLGGVIVEADQSTFSILMTKSAASAGETMSLLRSFDPISIETAAANDEKAAVHA